MAEKEILDMLDAAEAEVKRLSSEGRSARAAMDKASEAIGLLASVIKSGEPWTDTCERVKTEALTMLHATVSEEPCQHDFVITFGYALDDAVFCPKCDKRLL